MQKSRSANCGVILANPYHGAPGGSSANAFISAGEIVVQQMDEDGLHSPHQVMEVKDHLFNRNGNIGIPLNPFRAE